MTSRVSRPRLSIRAAALLALLVPAIAGCGSGAASASSGPASIEVVLSEWNVVPSASRISAGSAIFTVTNAGSMEHEMLVVRSDAAAGALPVTDGAIEEASIQSLGEVPETAVGASGTLRLDNLAKGHYILLCNIAGHYQQGMHADFSVE